jgi:hypothetical protein
MIPGYNLFEPTALVGAILTIVGVILYNKIIYFGAKCKVEFYPIKH